MDMRISIYILPLLLLVLPRLPAVRAIDCGSLFTDVGGKCIYVPKTSKGSWYTMKNLCKDIGGRLLTIDTENIHYYIVRYIKANGLDGHDYWVGANDEHIDGEYKWEDGTKVKMGTPFWGANDGVQEPAVPSEHCAILYKNDFFFMHDLDCGKTDVYAICEEA